MSPKQLLAYFDRIAEAPGAVPRLRRFIVDLAVRGKLVEQNPDDEPARQLLDRIRDRKRRSPADAKKVTEVSCDTQALDFSLPHGWALTTLAEILLELQTGPFGSSLHQSDYVVGGTPVINPASIRDERIVPVPKMAVDSHTLERLETFKLKAGDIVMARRGELGRSAVVTEKEHGWLCGTGSLILRLFPDIHARFIVLLLGSPLGRDYLGESAVGATMQNLNQGILLGFCIALPPVQEQRRIVSKVRELRALCDRLEAAQAERERRRDRVTVASLQKIAPGDSAVTGRDPFRVQRVLSVLARSEQIDELRNTILDLAVAGNLTRRAALEEFARGELEPFVSHKAGVNRLRESAKSPETASISESDLPFSAPHSWNWMRINDCFEVRGGIQKTPSRLPVRNAHPYVGVANVYRGRLELSTLKRFESFEGELEQFRNSVQTARSAHIPIYSEILKFPLRNAGHEEARCHLQRPV